MLEWLQGLSGLDLWFFYAAVFFSGLFIWQLVAGFLGLLDVDDFAVDHSDVGGAVATDAGGLHHADGLHAHDTVAAFKVVSLRSLLAFGTLFTWAGTLYMSGGTPRFWALSYAGVWGLAAMFAVALAFYLIQKLVESGTPNIATCVGTRGVIYLDIPEHGQGEARVLVSGAVSHVRAKAIDGRAIKAGTPVRIVKALSATTVEVEPVEE